MSDLARTRLLDAKHAGEYRVWLPFADGLEGEIDLKDELWGPLFEQLKDEAAFAALRFDPELRTIIWPNGADLARKFAVIECNTCPQTHLHKSLVIANAFNTE